MQKRQIRGREQKVKMCGLLGAWGVALSLVFGCASLDLQLPPLQQDEEATSQDYQFVPEDVVEVMVWKNPDLSREVTVRPDGKISLPLIGDVRAAGSTPHQLKANIREKLKAYYKDPPEVSIIVQRVKGYDVYVLGAVKTPGRHEVKTGTTFLQAVAVAGGLTEFASRNGIQLRRRTNDGKERAIRIRYKDILAGKQKNIVLKPRDIIIVP